MQPINRFARRDTFPPQSIRIDPIAAKPGKWQTFSRVDRCRRARISCQLHDRNSVSDFQLQTIRGQLSLSFYPRNTSFHAKEKETKENVSKGCSMENYYTSRIIAICSAIFDLKPIKIIFLVHFRNSLHHLLFFYTKEKKKILQRVNRYPRTWLLRRMHDCNFVFHLQFQSESSFLFIRVIHAFVSQNRKRCKRKWEKEKGEELVEEFEGLKSLTLGHETGQNSEKGDKNWGIADGLSTAARCTMNSRVASCFASRKTRGVSLPSG